MEQRGFTLVELLVAMLLSAIVAITLTTVTRSMSQEAKGQQMIVEAAQQARVGLDMLRMDLMRTGMFVAANPRNRDNKDSMVTSGTDGTQSGYYRNPIVHLNTPGNANSGAGLDSLVLVGSFIGDSVYEGEIEEGAQATIKIISGISEDMCLAEFNPHYAFAHVITGTGQTAEAKINDASASNCDSGTNLCDCDIVLEQGELAEGAFGERNVKVAANQAALYRVETVDGRNVLLRYFLDYDGEDPQATNCTFPTGAVDPIDYTSAVIIAENVVDFQVWFRAIAPLATPGLVNLPHYHSATTVASVGAPMRPVASNVIVGASVPGEATSNAHLTCPAEPIEYVIGPEHIRSAIVSLAVRAEETDQSVEIGFDTDTDTDVEGASIVVSRELAPPPSDDVGRYRVRRFYLEVKMPNLMSQMAAFQVSGTPAY